MIQYWGDPTPGGPTAGVTLEAAGEGWLRTNEMWINNSTVAELTLTRELRGGKGPSSDEGLRRERGYPEGPIRRCVGRGRQF